MKINIFSITYIYGILRSFCIILILAFATILLNGCPPPEMECVNFENVQPPPPPYPTVGYKVLDGFTDSGVGIVVGPFQWNTTPTQWTMDGFTRVDNSQKSMGTGYDLEVNTVNIIFIFKSGAPLDGISLKFGDYGGNLNIKINGKFQNFENFIDIDNTTIGGVKVSVIGGLTEPTGTLKLSKSTESIKFLAIGGQELWIDDVCPSK